MSTNCQLYSRPGNRTNPDTHAANIESPDITNCTTAEVLTDTPVAKEYADELTLVQTLQMGWTTVTVFTPWGDPMIFSFQPIPVNFSDPGFAWVCPYYER